MPTDLKSLIKKVKESALLSDTEKKDWLKKMESMKDEDLKELESILDYAAKIDMDKAVEEYEEKVNKAEEICVKAEETIESICREASPA